MHFVRQLKKGRTTRASLHFRGEIALMLIESAFLRWGLAALGGAAGGADEAAFLVDEGFLAAVGATLTRGLGAVGEVLLECTFHTHFPCVDAL